MDLSWKELDKIILFKEGAFMAIAKEQLRQIILENDINSAGDIYTLFKDMLQ